MKDLVRAHVELGAVTLWLALMYQDSILQHSQGLGGDLPWRQSLGEREYSLLEGPAVLDNQHRGIGAGRSHQGSGWQTVPIEDAGEGAGKRGIERGELSDVGRIPNAGAEVSAYRLILFAQGQQDVAK